MGLEDSNKYCTTDQMLLVNIVAENTDHPVLWEISHAEVYTNSKTIKIYQILQKNEKRECDLELIFWYQESIFDAITKLIYSKIITALQKGTSKPEEIVKSIPKFIELPTDVTDYLTSEINDTYEKNKPINTDDIKEKLINKITGLRDSFKNIILETYNRTENQDVSDLDKFTTYMDSLSEKFYCYISVCKFLRKEFTKYYIPFIRDLSKVEHIVYEDVSIEKNVRSNGYNKRTESSRCQYVRDLYSLCLEATTFLKMTLGRENAVVHEYTQQVSTILSTIRKWSIEVIERCTYNGCRDLLKVSYHIYVVLNPKHTDHFKLSQSKILMSMIMSILNTYGIDHCRPPKFNFLLLNSTYLEVIGYDDVLSKRLNSFVLSLENYLHIPIVENYSCFLNIYCFFENYLHKTDFFTKYKHMISFFYKGERKYIDEIYENICAITMDPSHVFKLYDIYFKFILGSEFYKVCVFVNYSINADHQSNLLRLNDCYDFYRQYKMLLNPKHFLANLSILVSNVDRFSSMVFDLCKERANIIENYLTNHKSKKKIPHFDVFGPEQYSNDLYLKVAKLKENTEMQFEKFGTFIKIKLEEIPKTIIAFKDRFKHFIHRKPKTILIEKVFEGMTLKTCELVKAANNMLSELIINI
ncbi:unnamed protein product [Macrosiphum euphorbiae]|uniref:Uncharacterized protein n=1 Tax=Macrosiphum euphorbiae TaxID=13131 RepID=A0AAV0XL37_9HEMI|nr:unnamed protein product [Macrosiphum euphorbiae]